MVKLAPKPAPNLLIDCSPFDGTPERRLIALLVSVRPSMKSLTMKSLLWLGVSRSLPGPGTF
jgi:hypothetical protein